MLISNYVYEKVGATHKKCIHYRNVLPQDKIFKWKKSDGSIWISTFCAFCYLSDSDA